MELTKYFEYNIFPQVIEYVKQHPTIDAKTALLIFTTDTVRNAVNYESIVNNMPKEKPLADLYPTFTQQINDVYHQYKGYLEQLEAFEDAITQIPDLSLDYIGGRYTTENIGKTKELLKLCEVDVFPIIEKVVTKYDVPEAQEIIDIINNLKHYNEHYFEAWEIRDIDQLLNKLYITMFALIDTVLTSIGFEGICTLYKEILENTGKEKIKYNIESPITLMSNATSSVFASITDPDTERVNLIKDKLREWFSGAIRTEELTKTYQSLLEHPTLAGITAYVVLFQSMGEITRINSNTKTRLLHIVQSIGNLALLVDRDNYSQIVEQLDNIVKQYNSKNSRECIDSILKVYDNVVSKLCANDIKAITTLVLTFYRNAITNSRYIPMAPSSVDADDLHYVAVIDKQNVLQTAASHDIQGIKVSPFMSSIKTSNAKTKIDKYLTSFLGRNNSKDSRISAYKAEVVTDLKLRYQDKWEPLFMAVKNKILARIPEGITTTDNIQNNTAELALLKAIAEVWADPTTTSNEREILERLLPPHTYMDFVNSAAQQGKNDIVCSSLKQLTPEELCVLCPDRWDNPNAVTNEEQELVNYIDKNTATMSFESYVLTGGMDDQYILLGLVKAYIQQLNKVFEGHGKFTVLSIPTAKANTEGLDIAVPFVMRNNNDTVTMGVYYIDSKSTTNANTKNGSVLSNITQCACTLFAIKESEIKQIKYKLLDIGDDLDELLPRLIDKHNTPVLSQMSHQDNKKLIISLLTYFSTLYTYTTESLDTDSLALDNPRKAEEAMGYQYGGLFNIISSIAGDNTAQAKFIVGEVFKEATYIIRELCKDIDSVIDVEMSAPVYITFKSFVDSLIPATKKELQKVQLAVIERSDCRDVFLW